MIYILAGLVLWSLSHGFKRMFPELRNTLGSGARGIVTLGIIIAIALMTLGYKTAEDIILWQAHDVFWVINNGLMLVVIYMFSAAGAKTRLSLVMRHPMLNATMIWAVAHILVNGDLASLILFGGLGAWAYITRIVVDRDAWEIPNPPSWGKEIGVMVTSVILYVGLIHIHDLLGPYPLWWGWPLNGFAATILSPFM